MRRIWSVAAALLLGLGLVIGVGPGAQAAYPRPVVSWLSTRMTPISTNGGVRIAVHGSGFIHVSAVTFGGVRGSQISVQSTGTLTVLAPRHAAGTVDVRVVAAGGTSAISTGDRLTYKAPAPPPAAACPIGPNNGYPPPTITSVSPKSTSVYGGGIVTITGTNLYQVSQVSFGNGVGAAGVQGVASNDSTYITLTMPPHAPGTVDLYVVARGGGTSICPIDQVTYVQPPAGYRPPTTPLVTDDRTTATLMSSPEWDSSPIAGFRYSNVSADVVAGNSSTRFSYVAAVNGSAQIALPTTAGNYGLQHLFVIAVTTTGVTSGITDHPYARAIPNWTTPTRITGAAGPGATAESCMSANKCVAIEGDGYSIWDGRAWSPTVKLTTASGGLISLQCTGPTFCAVLDGDGAARTFDGSAWSGPMSVFSPSNSQRGQMSCAAPKFCMVVTNSGVGGNSFIYNGSSWTAAPYVEGQNFDFYGYPTGTLSCAAASFCMLTSTGGTHTWNGSSWSFVDKTGPANFYGCSSATLCVGDDGTNSMTWTASGWTTGPPLPGVWAGSPAYTQCFGSGCFAMGIRTNGLYYFNGSAWSDLLPALPAGRFTCVTNYCLIQGTNGPDTVVDNGSASVGGTLPSAGELVTLACTDTRVCRALDFFGHQFSEGGSAWTEQPFPLGHIAPTTPAYALGAFSAPSSLSCVTSFCMAVGQSSDASSPLAWTTDIGTGWASPSSIPDGTGATELYAVSCASSTFCVGTENQNAEVRTWDGSSWSSPTQLIPQINSHYLPVLSSISCPTTSYCMAVGGTGAAGGYAADQVAIYQNGSWQSPQTVENSLVGLSDVSCVSTPTSSTGAVFCAVVDGWGAVLTYDGSSWSAPQQLDPLPPYTGSPTTEHAISCGSPTLCVMVGVSNAYVWDGTSWSTAQMLDPAVWGPIGGNGLVDVSCPTATSCTVVGENGDVMTYTKP